MLARKRRRRKPVPFAISCAAAFIPEDLSQKEWEHELRKIIRSRSREQWGARGIIEIYDERITSIISEELQRN